MPAGGGIRSGSSASPGTWCWGTALDGDHLELVRTTSATVDSKEKMLHMALDGEVEIFYVPLEFRLLPAALQVLVPPQEGGR